MQKEHHDEYFPGSVAKSLRTVISQNTCRRLLLNISKIYLVWVIKEKQFEVDFKQRLKLPD